MNINSDTGVIKSLGSAFKSIMGGKEAATGAQFRDSLKDPKKFKISFMGTTLRKALDGFDILQKRNALLVYFETNDKARPNIEPLLLEAHGATIEAYFAFIGVTNQSSEIGLIQQFLVKEIFPSLLAFHYDEIGELKLIDKLTLDPDTLANKSKISVFLRNAADIANKTEEVYQASIRSLDNKNSGGHAPDHFDDDNGHFAPPPQPPQFHRSDNSLKKEQDEAYYRTLQEAQKKKEEEAKKRAEQEAFERQEAEKRRKMEEFKSQLENQHIDPQHCITLQMRFPKGDRIKRDFDRRWKVELVQMFAATHEELFESLPVNFVLKSGFPPKAMDQNQSLEFYFGNSEAENVQVTEI